MIQSLVDTFVLGGNSSLGTGWPTLEALSVSYSSAVMTNLFDKNPDAACTLLTATSISSALTSCSKDNNVKNVESASMLVESMSLDELYELRDLVHEKGASLKLYKEEF